MGDYFNPRILIPKQYNKKKKDNNAYFYEYFMVEVALARLLDDNIVFANSYDISKGGSPEGHTVVLFVSCNDLFAWGCADAECFAYHDIQPLYEAYMKGALWVDRWCCIHRNEKPQAPVIEFMKAAGVWDEELEALPDNYFDQICAAQHKD
jgi:hypothetical protein